MTDPSKEPRAHGKGNGEQKWVTVSFDASAGHFLAVEPPEGSVAAVAMTRDGITAMQTLLETAAKVLDGDSELAQWREHSGG